MEGPYKPIEEQLKEFEKVRCLLCGGKIPAHDREVQIEHMMDYHKAESREEAERMAVVNFVKIR